MLVFNKKSELITFLKPFLEQNKTIGFVPTMGALHLGHLSLLEKSSTENDYTVMSIFVNPTQFNNPDDLEKYPRMLEKDIEKIKMVSDSILVYAPSVADMYENNPKSENFNFDGLEVQMEGKHRPGHFDGVGTIVKKLLEIVQPTFAYFGEKDFQQLQIVKKLVKKHLLKVEIVGCPIFREMNGLAMSSRNERLSAEAKSKSAFIYEQLQVAKLNFLHKSAKETIQILQNNFEKHPEFQLEYIEIADEQTLLPIENKENNKKYRAFIAVFIEKIRLIDNIALN
jgi:pantoate--beta-alanine ligase